jgi:hypothetical protein
MTAQRLVHRVLIVDKIAKRRAVRYGFVVRFGGVALGTKVGEKIISGHGVPQNIACGFMVRSGWIVE